MEMRKIMLFSCVAALMAFGQTACAEEQPSDPADPECHVNVDTNNGKGGTQVQVCKDHASIGFGGPIKDVDLDHPVGKGQAFIPKAGRDAQTVVQDVGHGVEHAAHELGKTAQKIFNW